VSALRLVAGGEEGGGVTRFSRVLGERARVDGYIAVGLVATSIH
jgi:hypothetical protein